MTADTYLPIMVRDLPVSVVLGSDGRLKPKVRAYVAQGVVRVMMGPERCDVLIDVRRPYFRPKEKMMPQINGFNPPGLCSKTVKWTWHGSRPMSLKEARFALKYPEQFDSACRSLALATLRGADDESSGSL